MKTIFRVVLLAAAALSFATTASAQTYGAVYTVPNVTAFSQGNFKSLGTVDLAGFNADGDGGGGKFKLGAAPSPTTLTGNTHSIVTPLALTHLSASPLDQHWAVGEPIADSLGAIPANTYIVALDADSITISQNATSAQTGDTFTVSTCANGGSILTDGALNCFFRTDLNGDLRQWGLTAGSVYDWNAHIGTAADAAPILTAAQAVNQAAGISVLHTKGVSLFIAESYPVAGGMSLSCDGVPGTVPPTSGYFNVPSAIHEAHGATINRSGSSTSVYGCYLLPGYLTFSPTTPQQAFQILAAMKSNGDTGLTCNQASCNDHDLAIFGFDTGLDAHNAPENILQNVLLDDDVCLFMHSVAGEPRWQNTSCFTYLTKGVTIGSEEDYTIASVSNSGGLCHVTVTPIAPAVLSDLQYANYIYLTTLPPANSGCQGQWKMANLNTTAGTFDLVGSQVSGPTAFAYWAAGTNVIYVSDDTNVVSGEVINGMDAQGIPTGTTVSIVWPLPVNTNGYLADTGTANAYVVTAPASVQPCTLADGTNVSFTPAHTNTTASTLTVTLNSQTGCTGGTTGSVAVVRQTGAALQGNELVAGSHAVVHYSAALTKWILYPPKVILSVPTTLANNAPISTTFVNAVCNPCRNADAFILWTARVDAGASPGGVAAGGTGFATCTMIGGPIPKELAQTDKVAGFQEDQGFCYDHTVELHVENSNETGLTNWGTDSHGFTDNPNQYVVIEDGEDNNIHIIGRKAGKAGSSILVNSSYPDEPDRGAFNWISAAVSATLGTDTIVDVEQGSFRMMSGLTNTTGSDLIANSALSVRLDVYQPKTTVWYEGALAQGVTNTLGSTLTDGESNPMVLGNVAPTSTTSRTVDSTAAVWPCDATSNDVTLTLPTSAMSANQQFDFPRVDSSSHNCIVHTASADVFLITGSASYYLYTKQQELTVKGDGKTTWLPQ